MIRYIGGRILQILPVLVAISFLVFLLVRLIPGDPATAVLGPRATPELVAQVRAQLHLDDPFPEQYLRFILDATQGDFGTSYFYGASVWSITMPRVPMTLALVVYASILALAVAVPTAMLAAARRGRVADEVVRVVFTLALGIPSFWLGLVLALYLGVHAGLFPVAGEGAGGLDTLYHLTLPAVTIAVSMAPLLVRALRSSLIEVLESDYISTGRACGLKSRFLLPSYLLRNSVLPLITIFSINIGWLIGGTVIVEQIFSIPGLGSLLISSITTHDYSIVQMVTLILALIVIVVNLLTDLVYVVFDPRVELSA